MITPRYEETAMHRAELEAAMRENEALKRRIRELESLIRSGGGGERSSSVGTGRAVSRSGRAKDREVDEKDRVSGGGKDGEDNSKNVKAEENTSNKGGYAETSRDGH